jgi:hypothetical protein
MQDQQTTSYPCLGSIDVHGGYQVEGNPGTYSHEQPEGNPDNSFHSRPSVEALNELSSSPYGYPQQEATLPYARFDDNDYLMDPSSEQLSTSPIGTISFFILTHQL